MKLVKYGRKAFILTSFIYAIAIIVLDVKDEVAIWIGVLCLIVSLLMLALIARKLAMGGKVV
jgi:hypothetical protein